MTKRSTQQQRARDLQKAATDAGQRLGYHDALNHVRAATGTEPAVPEKSSPVEQLLAIAYTRQPTPAEAAEGITAEELGVSALPADATPAQRAHAEAVWRPAEPDQPCRCSGTGCFHGAACPDNEEGCSGRLVHLDRHPGSLWGLTTWWDEYACADCEESAGRSVELSELPWGEFKPNDDGPGGMTLVFDKVRHPNFPDFDSDFEERSHGDGLCRGCGGYALDGYLCDGCEADAYEDEHGRDCECGADHEYRCVC